MSKVDNRFVCEI